jgi:hypothetical protein
MRIKSARLIESYVFKHIPLRTKCKAVNYSISNFLVVSTPTLLPTLSINSTFALSTAKTHFDAFRERV